MYIRREKKQVKAHGKIIQVAVFPISIDYQLLTDCAISLLVQKQALEIEKTYSGQYLGIGLDRLDYTKGNPGAFRGDSDSF